MFQLVYKGRPVQFYYTFQEHNKAQTIHEWFLGYECLMLVTPHIAHSIIIQAPV